MKQFHTLEEYGSWRLEQNKIAFIPTMGNLHEGHLSLVKKARNYADTIVVSIFVNTLQFAIHEDLSKYPRTLKEDFEKLAKLDIAAVLVPETTEMYPPTGHQQTQVQVPELSKELCGRSRPHFFTGVATVVCKLFNIVKPNYAIFGEKDYQQILVIRKMVADLNMAIKIISAPIVREKNGLAMSSRNGYLSKTIREKAGEIYAALKRTAEKIRAQTDVRSILQTESNLLKQSGFDIDYFELRDEENLTSLSRYTQTARLFIAVVIEKTRLIDNLKV